MSPRAACRLEALGFSEVYDYTAGKADWLARGLPTEGENAAVRRAHHLLSHDVVTCMLDEPVAAVAERVAGSRYGFAFVVSPGGVLLGRLRRTALEGDAAVCAADLMEPGPSTVRADLELAALLKRMDRRQLTSLPVTDPEGHFLGLVRRDDVELATSS